MNNQNTHNHPINNKMSPLNTIFGGALIGTSFTTPQEVQELLDQLKTLQIDHIDTAARYAPTNPGSERDFWARYEPQSRDSPSTQKSAQGIPLPAIHPALSRRVPSPIRFPIASTG
jgi:hypothetical protein